METRESQPADNVAFGTEADDFELHPTVRTGVVVYELPEVREERESYNNTGRSGFTMSHYNAKQSLENSSEEKPK